MNLMNTQSLPSRPMDPEAFADDIQTGRILLVDDSRTIRRMFSNYLSPRFECVEARSFDEAVAELKAGDFAVVITDIIMPGMSGIELLRKIVADFPTIAVIIVTGVDRSQRVLDAMRLGAFDYLIKPCDVEVLEFTVERALKQRSLILKAGKYKLDLESKNVELVRQTAQLQRLHAQMVQNAKMASLGQLAAGIAHEINNPVGFVSANLEILQRYTDDLMRLVRHYDIAELSATNAATVAIKNEIDYPAIMSDVNSMIADCREGAERIRDIVQNLRTFSRLDEAEYKDTDIHEGIEATIRLLSRYFGSGDLVLSRNYAALPLVGAFSGQLNQVWMNLLVNASQAITSGRGEVQIETSFDDENIFVQIRDNGNGIAIQHLDRIFDPFFTTKPIGEGTGLGLSISFGIVEKHGGEISVTSRLNEGTTFTVRLPRQFEPAYEADQKSIACYVEI